MIDTSTAAVTLVCNALKEYVCWHGPIHEEEQEDGSECPGDDTCECGHKWLNDGANGACRLLPALAEERDGLSELCHRAVEDRNALFQRVTELESANMRLRESWREDVAEARAERDAEQQRADGMARFLEHAGYRRCDIPACNCGSYHGGHASRRLDEIREALEDAGIMMNGVTLLAGVQALRQRADAAETAVRAMVEGDEGTVQDIIRMAVRLCGDDDPNREEIIRLLRHVVRQGTRAKEAEAEIARLEAEAVTLRGANKRLMVVVKDLEAEIARLRAQMEVI